MIQVTVKTAKHTHNFDKFPVDWDSVEDGVKSIEVFTGVPLTRKLVLGGDGKKFAFNKGLNDLATGNTTTTFVCGVIDENDKVTAFEVFKNGYFIDVSSQVDPMILAIKNQPNNRLIK